MNHNEIPLVSPLWKQNQHLSFGEIRQVAQTAALAASDKAHELTKAKFASLGANPVSQLQLKPMTGIRTVAFFRDGTGRCCDRCGTFIKNVALVTFKDGSYQSYGSECINKILSGDTSLLKLWKTNAKLLQKWQKYLEVLSRPIDKIPVDPHGYYNRGLFFVSDDEGKGICCGMLYNLPSSGREIVHSGCNIFHPTRVEEPALSTMNGGGQTFDMRGPAGGNGYDLWTRENWEKHCTAHIEAHKRWLQREITRISAFLARILEKGLVTKAQVES